MNHEKGKDWGGVLGKGGVGDLNGVVSSGGEDAGECLHTAGTRWGPHWPADGAEE